MVPRLSELLGTTVQSVDDCIGEKVKEAAGKLENGQVPPPPPVAPPPSLPCSFLSLCIPLPAAHLLAAPSGARPHEASVDPSICSLRGNDVSEDRYMLVWFGMICSFMYPAGEVSSCVDRARKLRS